MILRKKEHEKAGGKFIQLQHINYKNTCCGESEYIASGGEITRKVLDV
jgi:hypothetical protein